MKSIKEKAKAYDMAIERLRNAFYDNNSRMCDEYRKAVIRIIEPIFPELKESSEDEKFRKYILKCCEETIHADDRGLELSMDTTKKLKNWLEKQGKKVEPIEGFNSEFERQVSRLIASTINKEHEYNEGYVKWTANALLEYAKRELEKQGDKKSEEEVDNLHNYLYGEQNLAWSEEDERKITELKTFIAKCNGFNRENREKAFGMIDSLRPQNRWKPSYIQMEVLLSEVTALTEGCNKQIVLESLYQDLKKLKG